MRIGNSVLLLSALLGVDAHAQEMSILGGDPAAFVFSIEHQGEAAPKSNPDLSIEEQKASAAIPIYNQGSWTGGIALRGQRTHLGKELRFANRGLQIPQDFATAEAGFFLSHVDESNQRYGLSATYGSAGHRLLDEGRTPIVTSTFSFEKPIEEGRSWIYFLNYSNNRTFWNHVPLPGFAYAIKEKSRTLILGLPFLFANWRMDPYYVTAIIYPIGAMTEVSWRFWGPMMIYASLGWQPKAYQNLVQVSDERLIYTRKELAAGLRLFAGRKGSLSVGYVWNFDRRLFIGTSLTQVSEDVIDVDDSGGMQIKARASF